eukprot:CAMPEP_0172705290 /NCGR_PEP_ID=MMETSP1074-20121228/43098_1 /TAXON_ID=2916 /ORGANISM="Ceratium fusus, Strain PA161109" /LENGTH=60 /DNA_ID=CAMNT_0013527609 /DNA_START=115 /DNA_END=294 /DNA_ORIENTATION=-
MRCSTQDTRTVLKTILRECIAPFLKPPPPLAAGCGDGSVHLMDPESGATIRCMHLASGRV